MEMHAAVTAGSVKANTPILYSPTTVSPERTKLSRKPEASGFSSSLLGESLKVVIAAAGQQVPQVQHSAGQSQSRTWRASQWRQRRQVHLDGNRPPLPASKKWTAMGDYALGLGCHGTPSRSAKPAGYDHDQKDLEDGPLRHVGATSQSHGQSAHAQCQHSSRQIAAQVQGFPKHLGVQPKKNYLKNGLRFHLAESPSHSLAHEDAAPPRTRPRSQQPTVAPKDQWQSTGSCKPIKNLRVSGEFLEPNSDPHTPALSSQIQKVQQGANADPNESTKEQWSETQVVQQWDVRQLGAHRTNGALRHKRRIGSNQLRKQAQAYGWNWPRGSANGQSPIHTLLTQICWAPGDAWKDMYKL